MSEPVSKRTESLLGLIDRIDYSQATHSSRERGKIFFNVPGIGKKVTGLLRKAKLNKTQFAEKCGFSVETLNSLLASEQVTDSMLFRLRIGANAVAPTRTTEAWIHVDEPTQKLVNDVIQAIRNFYGQVRRRNSIDQGDGPLSPLERAQVLAVLEAMLAELRAPAVSRNRITEVSRWFSTMVARVAKDTAEREFSGLAALGMSALKGLARHLMGKTGLDIF